MQFLFESALIAAGVPVRNLEEEKMFHVHNKPGVHYRRHLSAPLVVTMRPMKPEQAIRATQVTTRFHLTHGAPVHFGSPEEIGVADLGSPDFGEPVTIKAGEIPLFWACGVTSQMAVLSARLPMVITHAPGYMFVSDMRDEQLTLF